MVLEGIIRSAVSEILAHPYSIIFCLVIVLVAVAWILSKEPPNLPPGPKCYPVIGNLLSLEALKPHESMAKLAEKYGPIFRLYFGDVLVIVLNDVQTIKEAFSGGTGEICSGRPWMPQFDVYAGGKLGIICSDGDRWKEQRRFTLSQLRDFGLGRPQMVAKISAEIDTLLGEIGKLVDAPNGADLSLSVKNCSANIICSVIIGVSFPPGDPLHNQYQKGLEDLIENFTVTEPFAYIKGLRFMVRFSKRLAKIREVTAFIREGFLRKQIDDHLEQLRPGSTGSKSSAPEDDYTTAYLTKMMQIEEKKADESSNGVKEHWFSLPQLEATINDLFLAGQETTSTTMMWTILYLTEHMSVQAKLQAEMDSNVGQLPNWDDRQKLPYTQAVIAEVQRIANIAPFGVLHSAQENVKLSGYSIPNGATIISNLWAAHKNAADFPEPNVFKPERFIDPESGALCNTEKIIPFSIGKRACLGESLARMELFLLTTAIFYRYRFVAPERVGARGFDFEPIAGGTLRPKPFRVKIIRRMTGSSS